MIERKIIPVNRQNLNNLEGLRRSYKTIQEVEEVAKGGPPGATPMLWWTHETDGTIAHENDPIFHNMMRGVALGMYRELASEGLKDLADETIETVLFESPEPPEAA